MSRTGSQTTPTAAIAGFTLLELLIVLTLMALLVLAIPVAASHFAKGVRLRETAQELAADLRSLHGLAVNGGHETRLVFDLPENRYSVTGNQTVRQLPRNVKLIVTTTVDSGAPISHTTAILRLFPDGTSNGGRIELVENARHYVVKLNWLTSRVQIDE